MTRAWTIAATLAATASLGSAAAQADGGGNGVAVGGSVTSELALSIGTASAFSRVLGADAYQLTIPVRVTSTGGETLLSVADGEDPSGPAHGRLHTGAGLLPDPLQVGVAGRPLQSLASPSDPIVFSWSQPLALTAETIDVRESATPGSIDVGSTGKVLLITASTEGP